MLQTYFIRKYPNVLLNEVFNVKMSKKEYHLIYVLGPIPFFINVVVYQNANIWHHRWVSYKAKPTRSLFRGYRDVGGAW